MPEHRQHPSILVDMQPLTGVQDGRKAPHFGNLQDAAAAQEKTTNPRRTACHPSLTTPCNPAEI